MMMRFITKYKILTLLVYVAKRNLGKGYIKCLWYQNHRQICHNFTRVLMAGLESRGRRVLEVFTLTSNILGITWANLTKFFLNMPYMNQAWIWFLLYCRNLIITPVIGCRVWAEYGWTAFVVALFLFERVYGFLSCWNFWDWVELLMTDGCWMLRENKSQTQNPKSVQLIIRNNY